MANHRLSLAIASGLLSILILNNLIIDATDTNLCLGKLGFDQALGATTVQYVHDIFRHRWQNY